tara:strand:- start:39 stop:215 length:177 start_codon:yes stop_codon:yes gene_type:complete
MNITTAKYCPKTKWESDISYITATIDGVVMYVPIDINNIEYQAIQEWVAEGNKIEAAD